MQTHVVIDEDGQGIGAVEAVARLGAKVSIAPAAVERMEASRRLVEGFLSDGRAHYGINTGFGSLSRTRIADHEVAALQRNLIRSHSAGVGPLLAIETVRGMMFLLAASLARGRSGARPLIAQTLVEMLNKGVTPAVPETGSVGASGDLAPLAHMALACIGEGHVVGESGVVRPAAEALREAGIAALELEAKEGLAMINGTHLMAAQGALLVADARALLRSAITAAAMSIDAARATDSFLDARVYEARAQRGPGLVAAAMRELLAGSEILVSHREDDPRVQDPYSFRCAPAVLGAAADALLYVNDAVERELSAVTDNPLVFSPGKGMEAAIISAGNFHGMPVAIPLDTLAIAVCHIAGISERRTFWMLAAYEKESQLPHYLTPRSALHSGLMIAQYTAAACCNEIIGLAAPASVANIPTSAGVEDYNSFGPRSAAKARRAIDLATHVVAIELLCAAQGLEYHRPLRSGRAIEGAHGILRGVVPALTDDRPVAPDIKAISGLMRDAKWMSAAGFDGVEAGASRGIS